MTLSKFYTIIIRWFPIAILTALLVYLMVWRVRVGMTRYFDADEFSYLHWGANAAKGLIPYKDYFLLATPGFVWFLAPIFWLTGVSTQIFLTVRAVALVIFAGILTELGLLFGLTRSRKWAILPVVILAFLPMPYDKFFEIRPDNLSTLLAFTGLILEVFVLTHHGKRERVIWFFSGFAYMASLLVLMKTIPFVIAGFTVAIMPVIGKFVRSPKKFLWQDIGDFLHLVAGFFLPLAGFFVWLIATGAAPAAWYLLTRAPFEIYFHWQEGYFGANLFFYPNGAFYGGNSDTITIGLLTNHFFWILGIGMGTYRLFTPYMRGRFRGRVLAELLIALTFFISAAGFVKYFPQKFAQYLIPIAVFIAYYGADALSVFFDWLLAAGGWASLGIVISGFACLLAVVTKDVNRLKLVTTNTVEINDVAILMRTVPLTARVVDMEGRMLFWREAYPICCLPFDTYLPSLSHPPLTLALYLSTHPADYLYDGDSTGMATLTAGNLSFIRAHFAPVDGFGNKLWKRL